MKKIKSLDKFGHKVEINFDNKGSEHKTMLGAVCSIVVNIIICIFVFGLVKKLVNNEDDSISTVTKYVNPVSIGEIQLDQTNFVPVF